jgi:peptidoglycan hydrolase CwlO-like protein
MSKIIKISSNRDKIIDQLIDDKNKLYMKLKKLEKRIEVNLSQIEHWKLRYQVMKKKLEERNEERDSRIKTKGSGKG